MKSIKEQINVIIELEPDLIVTCVYGILLPIELLNYPNFACINNVYESFLPKQEVCEPILRSILEGYTEKL